MWQYSIDAAVLKQRKSADICNNSKNSIGKVVSTGDDLLI